MSGRHGRPQHVRVYGCTGRRVVAVAAIGLALGGAVLAAPEGGDPGTSAAAATLRRGVGARADAAVVLAPRATARGRDIPQHYVGVSVEWSLVERYMSDGARPAFANLLRNLGTGVLRVGGGSQDLMPFDASAQNDRRVITPADLAAVRATLDIANAGGDAAAPRWGTILGTAMAPRTAEQPFVGVEHAVAFRTQGVEPAFAGPARNDVVGIELGNEPDVSYGFDAARYEADLTAYTQGGATTGLGLVGPNTSEPIAPWQDVRARAGLTRFFWDWPRILDATAPLASAHRGPFGAFASDHFYPQARSCANDPYRCATIRRLLSDERFANLQYQVYVHATEAARHGLGYRLEEMNSSANRGAHGVSDVAASAVWALEALFSSACPQPPDAPGTNADCTTGAVGVNFHNAEVGAFFAPEEGNAYYNPIRFDPSPAAGAPTAAPEYYGLLLFAALAQGQVGLRPVDVALRDGDARVRAWRMEGTGNDGRIFLVNPGDGPATVDLDAPASRYELDRMTPYDPTGAGRTLEASEVRIDGRTVAADGTWPGLAPATGRIGAGPLELALPPGEAAVVTLHAASDHPR